MPDMELENLFFCWVSAVYREQVFIVAFGVEADSGLGDGKEHEDRESSVESEHARLVDGVLRRVDEACLREFLVELHLGLEELGRVGAA